EIVDQLGEGAYLPRSDLTGAGDARIGRASLLDHLQRGHECAERVAKLVTEHREELVLGAVRGLRLAQETLALGLKAESIADVTGDLGGADDVAGGVADRRDGERDVHRSAAL